jgi:O-antigen ligase
MYPLFLKIYIIFGFILAINHLQVFIAEPILFQSSFLDLRSISGGSRDLVTISIALLFCGKKLGLNNFTPKNILFFLIILILSLSFILSASRTETIFLLILLSIIFLKLNFRSLLIFFITIAISYMVIVSNPLESNQISFFSQMGKMFSEIGIDDYITSEEIINSWRGYETFLTKQQFLSGNSFQKFFGQGFGAITDLGLSINLGGDEHQYISVFHNGYAYILLKTGILGLFSYLLFYFRAFKFAMYFNNSTNQKHIILSKVVIGCLLCLATGMYVVGGMPQMHNPELILLLSFLQYKLFLESKTI